MTSNKEYPEWQYRPFWLNTEDMENLQLGLQQFFETYSLPVCRQYLWDMLMGYMSSDLADDLNRNDRSDLLFFYQSLSGLIEAANLLSLKQ